MGLLIATVAGLTIWIVLWAAGAKAFDSFMLGMAVVVIVATVRIFAAYLPGRRSQE